jgi:hypothetical protein
MEAQEPAGDGGAGNQIRYTLFLACRGIGEMEIWEVWEIEDGLFFSVTQSIWSKCAMVNAGGWCFPIFSSSSSACSSNVRSIFSLEAAPGEWEWPAPTNALDAVESSREGFT